MRTLVILTAAVFCLAAIPPLPQAHPDFSGKWTFDLAKSSVPGPDGRIVIARILGEEFVAKQDAAALTLTITADGLSVTAVYTFEGESRNLSPGGRGQADVPVTSRLSWDGAKLVILSTSSSIVNGRKVTVETTRLIWLNADGDLIIERTGTPSSEVIPSRSVYRRVVGVSARLEAVDGRP